MRSTRVPTAHRSWHRNPACYSVSWSGASACASARPCGSACACGAVFLFCFQLWRLGFRSECSLKNFAWWHYLLDLAPLPVASSLCLDLHPSPSPIRLPSLSLSHAPLHHCCSHPLTPHPYLSSASSFSRSSPLYHPLSHLHRRYSLRIPLLLEQPVLTFSFLPFLRLIMATLTGSVQGSAFLLGSGLFLVSFLHFVFRLESLHHCSLMRVAFVAFFDSGLGWLGRLKRVVRPDDGWLGNISDCLPRACAARWCHLGWPSRIQLECLGRGDDAALWRLGAPPLPGAYHCCPC